MITGQTIRKPKELPELSCLVEENAPTPLQPVQLSADAPIIWCKLEYLNPSGSTKDRIASYILSKARPVHIEGQAEYSHGCFGHSECCSFSTCVPGVMDNQSKIFDAAKHPDLLTIEVEEDDALETTRRLIRRGFAVGPSSGLNYAAAAEASRVLEKAEKIVTVFPDRMERYFSTGLFLDEY